MLNNAHHRHLITCLAALALLVSGSVAQAETVLLTRGDNDFGLGWLFLDSKGQCRIATPRHVIDTGTALVAPDLIDTFGRQHATSNPRAAEDDLDLAFLDVLGELPQHGCTMSRLSGSSLQTIVDRMETATLSIATLYERQSIAVAKRASSQDELGGSIIALSTVDAGMSFQRGMSGGAVMLNGRPIGMLLEVDTEVGIGIALRFDVIADNYQRLAEAAPAGARDTASGALEAITIAAGQIASADAGISQYLAGQSDLVLAPAKDRVVLQATLPTRQVFDRVEIAGTFPAGSSVIVETADQTTGYLYAERCTLSPNSECQFSPRYADRLKLTFPATAGDTLSFSSLAAR